LTSTAWAASLKRHAPYARQLKNGGDLLFARRLREHESQWQVVTTGGDNQRRQVDIVAVAGH
jgi:hypothetical protein